MLEKLPDNTKVATFAGGCFWCIESAFEGIDGVIEAISGYTEGDKADATYQKVASGTTGHREAVQVYYDPKKTNYQEIARVFWQYIDPTDDSGQFADRGLQYRTAVYYHDDEQKQIAKETMQELKESGKFSKPIVTEILPYTTFFRAEEEHQNFHRKKPAYYERYKEGSGRGPFIRNNWGNKKIS